MNQNNILEKLGIETLNPMQKEALEVLTSHNEVVLLSPTGTGKTVAFLLPLIESLSTFTPAYRKFKHHLQRNTGTYHCSFARTGASVRTSDSPNGIGF